MHHGVQTYAISRIDGAWLSDLLCVYSSQTPLGDTMNTFHCTTCGTQLKSYEAVLRGNAIDSTPTAWCRLHAVTAGILNLPTPAIGPSIPAQRAQSLRERLLAGQR